jgi:hypothetical protein
VIQNFSFYEVQEAMDLVMKQVLHLGQSCLSEHQFKSFRKLTMDFFQEGKKRLGTDRCGESKEMVRTVVHMSE